MPDQNRKLGTKIKSLRTEKKQSIADVSAQTGLPEADISEIEEGRLSPPLGNIVSLANAFQVSLGDFFGDSADAPFCIVRGNNRKTVPRFNSADGNAGGYTYESLGHQKQNRKMEPFLVTLTPAAAVQAEPNQHAGEEIIFVLEGEVKVSLSEHTDILTSGDSIYYDANLPHIVSCHGATPATILAVIYAEKELEIF